MDCILHGVGYRNIVSIKALHDYPVFFYMGNIRDDRLSFLLVHHAKFCAKIDGDSRNIGQEQHNNAIDIRTFA